MREAVNPDPPALAPTDHGWVHPEETSNKLVPVVIPYGAPHAPADL